MSARDCRFATVIGLAATLVAARILLINEMRGFQPLTWAQLPFFFRYDAMVAFVLAWLVCRSDGSSRTARRTLDGLLGTAICLLIVFAAINVLMLRELHLPLTYRLVVISDRMRGIAGAMGELFLQWAGLVAVASALTFGVSFALRRLPSLLVPARRWFFSPAATLAIVMVLTSAHVWAAQQIRPSELEANPLVSFVLSLGAVRDPVLTGRADDGADFLPGAGPDSDADGLLRTSGTTSRDRLPNVVMIVMESVGAKWLRLYGGRYENSAEIEQLARRGATFRRVYASSPNTSSAMAALFCSVYPLLSLRAVTRMYPDLQIPGLPALLARRGYRTALVHGGNLDYDREREFLQRHGFADVVDNRPAAATRIASEAPTLDPALEWLRRHYGDGEGAGAPVARSRPFFLTLWTVQTHFTYYFDDRSASGTETPFDRYLKGIAAADRLVGEVRRAIDSLGFTDDTLFIVTGDHGETFGLHGRRAHGFEIYNEEMWTPLVIAGPGVAVQTVNTPVRQIDLAPTILGLLGQAAPAEWQGIDLTKRPPPSRVYLFTGWRDFRFGVIENERKAIFHYPEGANELYDLRSDPDEQRNLAATEEGARELANARERIEAWIGFQNLYLARFSGG